MDVCWLAPDVGTVWMKDRRNRVQHPCGIVRTFVSTTSQVQGLLVRLVFGSLHEVSVVWFPNPIKTIDTYGNVECRVQFLEVNDAQREITKRHSASD